MNILQSLISNSLLLAPCIVRTFKKSLTAVNIIKFTEEDEMKYLIIKHSNGNKKQQKTQGQERVDCLKIDKRRKWVRYLTQQKEITITDTYNNERLKRIKEENINVIKGKIHLVDVEASITNMIMNPNKEWLACKKTLHLT
jgi:hypothetical protein